MHLKSGDIWLVAQAWRRKIKNLQWRKTRFLALDCRGYRWRGINKKKKGEKRQTYVILNKTLWNVSILELKYWTCSRKKKTSHNLHTWQKKKSKKEVSTRLNKLDTFVGASVWRFALLTRPQELWAGGATPLPHRSFPAVEAPGAPWWSKRCGRQLTGLRTRIGAGTERGVGSFSQF